jgi:hypothetical protein
MTFPQRPKRSFNEIPPRAINAIFKSIIFMEARLILAPVVAVRREHSDCRPAAIGLGRIGIQRSKMMAPAR